jgi:transposase-like protein
MKKKCKTKKIKNMTRSKTVKKTTRSKELKKGSCKETSKPNLTPNTKSMDLSPIRRKELEESLRIFESSKHVNVFLVIGAPGSGKDELIKKLFPEATILKGYITSRGLFDTMASKPDSIIVLSDVYGWEDDQGMNILKAAYDDKPTRTITWKTVHDLQPVDFNGKMIILTNHLKKNLHLDAMKSRGEVFYFDLSETDFRQMAKKVIKESFKVHKYCDSLTDLMVEHQVFDLRKVKQYYEKILQYRKQFKGKNFETEWKDKILKLYIGQGKTEHEFEAIKSFARQGLSAKESSHQFTRKFNCTDRTFYRWWEKARELKIIAPKESKNGGKNNVTEKSYY